MVTGQDWVRALLWGACRWQPPRIDFLSFSSDLSFHMGAQKRHVPQFSFPPMMVTYQAARLISKAFQISRSAATRLVIISSLWAGEGVMRRRSVPRATVG